MACCTGKRGSAKKSGKEAEAAPAPVVDVPAAKPDLSAVLTIKDGTEPQEYYDLFWAHASSKTITAKGKEYTLPAPRSAFCDEAKTTIYVNTKDPKELMLSCYSVDMETMGKMMGGPEFQEMGAAMWDMDPAKDMKLRVAAPPEGKAALIAWTTLKEGTTADEYCELFWSHADKTTITWKGKDYDIGMSRGSFVDDSKSKIFVNSKNPQQLAICVYDVDLKVMGEMMGGEAFTEMAKDSWEHPAIEFLNDMPPPPAAAAAAPAADAPAADAPAAAAEEKKEE